MFPSPGRAWTPLRAAGIPCDRAAVAEWARLFTRATSVVSNTEVSRSMRSGSAPAHIRIRRRRCDPPGLAPVLAAAAAGNAAVDAAGDESVSEICPQLGSSRLALPARIRLN